MRYDFCAGDAAVAREVHVPMPGTMEGLLGSVSPIRGGHRVGRRGFYDPHAFVPMCAEL